MADEKIEGKQSDQSAKKPDEGRKDEISQEELGNVSGGIEVPRDTASGLPTGR